MSDVEEEEEDGEQGPFLGEYEGSFIYPDGSRYEGQWMKNMKEGTGTYYYANGDTYDGDWWQNMRHGNGTYTFMGSGLKYVGSWHKGKWAGFGELKYPNYKYTGRFRDNKIFGQGKFVFDVCCEVHGKYTLPSKEEAMHTDLEQEMQLIAMERALEGGGETADVDVDDFVLPASPPPLSGETFFTSAGMTPLHVMTEEEEEELKLVDELAKLRVKVERQIEEKRERDRIKAEAEAARLAREEAERVVLEHMATIVDHKETDENGEDGDEHEEGEDADTRQEGEEHAEDGEQAEENAET